jgi:hypothetical protein
MEVLLLVRRPIIFYFYSAADKRFVVIAVE